MQGDCEVDRQLLFGQVSHLHRYADGGNRDPPRTDVQTFRIVQNAHRRHDVGVVGHRLAHAHEHHIGDAVLRLALVGEYFVEPENLLDNLRPAEVPLHPVQAACAKFTSDGASHLRTDASRTAIPIGDHHCFGGGPIRPTEQKFARSVGAILSPEHRCGEKL